MIYNALGYLKLFSGETYYGNTLILLSFPLVDEHVEFIFQQLYDNIPVQKSFWESFEGLPFFRGDFIFFLFCFFIFYFFLCFQNRTPIYVFAYYNNYSFVLETYLGIILLNSFKIQFFKKHRIFLCAEDCIPVEYLKVLFPYLGIVWPSTLQAIITLSSVIFSNLSLQFFLKQN